MIINTGSRTDIPAYYSDWFYKRIEEGFVMVRNPYYPKLVTKYTLNPTCVDFLSFCTKNPKPMLQRLHELDAYHQFWYVTITPYDNAIEPNVPPYKEVVESVKELAKIVGKQSVGWRYDPIFLSEVYTIEKHAEVFREIMEALEGSISQCVISFIDLYHKTKKNFPEVKEVTHVEQAILAKAMSEIAQEHGIVIRPCLEGAYLEEFGMNMKGCLTADLFEEVLGEELNIPKNIQPAREGCKCLLGNDIGVYNTCLHFCKYCYANYDKELVLKNHALHDVNSPLLIGHLEEDDVIKEAKQSSWRNSQLALRL